MALASPCGLPSDRWGDKSPLSYGRRGGLGYRERCYPTAPTPTSSLDVDVEEELEDVVRERAGDPSVEGQLQRMKLM